MDSSLLVQGQTSSLYSYLGSRTHFRASVLLTGIFEEVDGSRSTFTDNVLFGPHLTFKSLAPDPPNPPKAPKAIAFVDDKLTVNKSMRDYLLAEDTREEKQQQLIENTCCDYTKVLVQDLKQKNKRVMFSIEKSMQKRTGLQWHTTEFMYTAAEIPVFNPHLLVRNHGEKMYKFISTQIDFVGVARAQRSDVFGFGQNLVVIGEFKTLMEKKNAIERITSTRTYYQVLVNAFMFELMTGIQVDVVMVQFFQRRKRKRTRKVDGQASQADEHASQADEQHCNMQSSLYIKGALLEDNELGQELRRIRAMVTTDVQLKKTKKNADLIYLDEKLFIAHENVDNTKFNDIHAKAGSLPANNFWYAYPNATMNFVIDKNVASSGVIEKRGTNTLVAEQNDQHRWVYLENKQNELYIAKSGHERVYAVVNNELTKKWGEKTFDLKTPTIPDILFKINNDVHENAEDALATASIPAEETLNINTLNPVVLSDNEDDDPNPSQEAAFVAEHSSKMEANILNSLESVLTSQNAFKDNAPRFNEAGQKLLLSIKTLKEVVQIWNQKRIEPPSEPPSPAISGLRTPQNVQKWRRSATPESRGRGLLRRSATPDTAARVLRRRSVEPPVLRRSARIAAQRRALRSAAFRDFRREQSNIKKSSKVLFDPVECFSNA